MESPRVRLAVLGRWLGVASTILLLTWCTPEQPTAPSRAAPVVRGWPGGCVPQTIVTSTDSTETVLVTFNTTIPEGQYQCHPNLVAWDIDMSDPVAVDTPQSNTYSVIIDGTGLATNIPSAPHILSVAPHTPPITWFEFDPPVSTIEFSYSRLRGQATGGCGEGCRSDSMLVLALSRYPGTMSYDIHDWKVLYSNVPSASPPWSVWTPVTLRATGDRIEWLELRGQLMLDDLKITRRPLSCPTSVVRGSVITCEVTSPHLTVTGWEFQPDSIAGLPALPPVQDTTTAKRWQGVVAVGGQVTARVTDGVTSRSLRARFAVTDRASTWRSRQTYRVGPELTAPTVEPALGVTFGRNCPEINGTARCVGTGRVQPDPGQFPGDGITVRQIGSGPNRGYFYIDSVKYEMRRVGNVNQAILLGSPMTHPVEASIAKKCRPALGFGPKDPVVANFNRYNDKCRQIDMTVFVGAVYGHEGFGYAGGSGHESLAQEAAARPGNDPYLAVDSLVAVAAQTVETRANARVIAIDERIRNRSDDGGSDGGGPQNNYRTGPMYFWDFVLAQYVRFTINGL